MRKKKRALYIWNIKIETNKTNYKNFTLKILKENYCN